MTDLSYEKAYKRVEADLDAVRAAVCRTPAQFAVFDRVMTKGGRFTTDEALATLVNALCTSPGRPKWPVATHILPLFRQRPEAAVLASRIETYLDAEKPRPFSLRDIIDDRAVTEPPR